MLIGLVSRFNDLRILELRRNQIIFDPDLRLGSLESLPI